MKTWLQPLYEIKAPAPTAPAPAPTALAPTAYDHMRIFRFEQ
jgi:hypothetical protein